MDNIKDSLYQVIGVPVGATFEDIKAACLRLGETYHPERDPGDADAARRFKTIEDAYAVLSDPAKRAAYDQELAAAQYTPATAPKPSPSRRGVWVMAVGGVAVVVLSLVAWYSPSQKDREAAALRNIARMETEVSEMWASVRSKHAKDYLNKILATTSSDLIIDKCDRPSERIAKCRVRMRSGEIQGNDIVARAFKTDEDTVFIDLPGAIVNGGTIPTDVAEITLILPEGTETVFLHNAKTHPPSPSPTPSGDGALASAPTPPSEVRTVVVGTLADDVLQRRGKALSLTQIGRDEHGLLVEWRYPDATYLMGRRLLGGTEAYRVIQTTPSPSPTPSTRSAPAPASTSSTSTVTRTRNETPVDCYALSRYAEAQGQNFIVRSETVANARRKGLCIDK